MSRRSKRSPDLFDTTGSSGTSPEIAQIMLAAAKGEPDRAQTRDTYQGAISLAVAVAVAVAVVARRRREETAGSEGVAA